MLATAGYPDGFDGNLFYVSGRWAGDDQVTQAMQAYWAQVGINIQLETVDSGSFGENLSDDTDNRAGWTTQQIRSSTYLDYHLYRLYHSESTLAVGAQRSGCYECDGYAPMSRGALFATEARTPGSVQVTRCRSLRPPTRAASPAFCRR